MPAGAIAASEEMLTIAPPPLARITGRACLMVSHMPLRLTVMIRSHAASSRRWAGASPIADADVVVQDVDPSQPRLGVGDEGLAVGLAGNVGGEGEGLATLAGDHGRGLLGRGQVAIDEQHAGAFAGEEDRGRPSVADVPAGRLAGPDDDRRLVRQAAAHASTRVGPALARKPRTAALKASG